MKKTILVLGGAGFIGSYANKLLDQHGYHTVVLDNLSRGSEKMVCCGDFIKGSIGNPEDLKKIFTKYTIDAVMDFAALIDVGESVKNPTLYFKNNVVETLAFLDAMRHYNVNHFIFSSSAAVYGMPQSDMISENHPCKPINPYGHSKLMVEHILESYAQAYGLKYCSLRYFNAAGGDPAGEIKNTKLKETNLIPLIIRSLKDHRHRLTIFGQDYDTFDGTCVRDYIHIHDLATAHILAMEKLFNGSPSETFNLGTGQGFSVQQVITEAENVIGKTLTTIEGERRPGDPPYLVADPSKAFKDLNWKPKYSLKDMLLHAWNSSSVGQ